MDNTEHQIRLKMTRQQLFGRTARGIGMAAIASLLQPGDLLAVEPGTDPKTGGLAGMPNFAP